MKWHCSWQQNYREEKIAASAPSTCADMNQAPGPQNPEPAAETLQLFSRLLRCVQRQDLESRINTVVQVAPKKEELKKINIVSPGTHTSTHLPPYCPVREVPQSAEQKIRNEK